MVKFTKCRNGKNRESNSWNSQYLSKYLLLCPFSPKKISEIYFTFIVSVVLRTLQVFQTT